MRLLCLAAAAVLAGAGTASAQEFDRAADKGAARTVFFQFGGYFDDATSALEVDSITTTGTPGPDNTSDANRRIDYQVRHQLLAAAIGIVAKPKEAKGLEASLSLLLGSMSTVLSESAEEGSIYNPNPGDGNFNDAATDDGSFVFGVLLRGHYLIENKAFVGIQYSFVTGESEFNDEPFFDNLVDGEYSFTRHRIQLFGGAKVGPAMPYVSIGFLLYESNADLQDADDPTPDTWDADFSPEGQFKLAIGLEGNDGGGVVGRIELMLLAETGVAVFAVVRI
ncbi:MAG: hypothetical protein L0216_13285 [Planctomycetales bacterium]|nr:hypothetical protein [Planctomycetales bacterium]